MTLDASDRRSALAPAALRLAWWGTAWLRGAVVLDLVLDAVIGGDATHLIDSAALGGPVESLVSGLGRLRAEGATSVGAAFPVEGDLTGLGGPASLNLAAVEYGEAVVTDAGVGLVPVRVGAAVTWTSYSADRRQLPDVGDADRGMRSALLATADSLARLDVARWRPEVADALMNLRHRPPLEGAPGIPARCVELAARALQARDIVALALEDDGAAVSAYEIAARTEALLPLERAARHALTAAGSPEVWPA